MEESDFFEGFKKTFTDNPPKPKPRLWRVIVYLTIACALGVTLRVLYIWGIVELLKSWGLL